MFSGSSSRSTAMRHWRRFISGCTCHAARFSISSASASPSGRRGLSDSKACTQKAVAASDADADGAMAKQAVRRTKQPRQDSPPLTCAARAALPRVSPSLQRPACDAQRAWSATTDQRHSVEEGPRF
jgi:hypothetical protein